MISKTKIGIDVFDREFGGTYQGRVTLISGPANTGKTAIALQFVNAGLQMGENALMLSAMPSRDLAIMAEGLDVDVDVHVESGALTILEYNDFVPGRDAEENIMLPPEGFSQLQSVIEDNGINRIAIDTVVPWISFSGNRHLAEHIFSFVRAFERLKATTLFTAPKPASPAAQRMLKYICDNVPVAVYLTRLPDGNDLQWRTAKYLGETDVDRTFKYKVEKGVGVVPVETRSAGKNPHGANRPNPAVANPDRIVSPFSKGFEQGAGSVSANKHQRNNRGDLSGQKIGRDDDSWAGGKSAFSNVVWKDGSIG